MPPRKPLSRLEALPQDVLGEILSRVAQDGLSTIRQCMQASIELATAAQDIRVFKKLNLKPLATKPLTTVGQYEDLMNRCIHSGNPEAHYIKGIIEYFHYNNTTTGIQHLQASAEGLYENGIYLYGIVMLCRGETEEGKKYLDMLNWEKCKRRAERCWRNNKISLEEILVIKKPKYFKSLISNKPSKRCKLNDMETHCKKCYYYKQMVKFMALN